MTETPIAEAQPDCMVEERRRSDLLDTSNRAFAALKDREEDWKEELEERAEWAVTLSDGLQSNDQTL